MIEYDQHKINESRFSEDDFDDFLIEILVNNEFSEDEATVLRRSTNGAYRRLSIAGKEALFNVIAPFIVNFCDHCLNEMRWIEMVSAKKRAERCYNCYVSYGTSEVLDYPFLEIPDDDL